MPARDVRQLICPLPILHAMNADLLLSALDREVRESVRGESAVAVAYSGGLDSSVIEAVARRHCPTVCYACSTENAFDARNAQARAEEDGCRCALLLISPQELMRYVADVARLLDTDDPVEIGYTIPILCVLLRSEERAVLAGNGADELFGGYAKYLDIEDPGRAMAEDLVSAQLESDRLKDAASSIQKRFETPFLAPQVVSVASTIPMNDKIQGDQRKIALRQVAMNLGLRSHGREKKASQYSSGTMRMMQRMAKQERLPLREWIVKLAAGSRRIP